MMPFLGVLSVFVLVGFFAWVGWLRGDPEGPQDREYSAIGGALYGLILSFAVLLPLLLWADLSGFTFRP